MPAIPRLAPGHLATPGVVRAAILVLATLAGRSQSEAQLPTVMFHGGLEHAGRYDSPAGPAFGGLVWRVATEGPVRSSPAVTAQLVLVGSADGFLYAIDRGTGRIRWTAAADGAINSSPAVDDSSAYFISLPGTAYAVALRDGHVRWSHKTGPSLPPAWAGASGLDYYNSSPAVAGDLVMVGSGDGYLYAFDRGSGMVRWRAQTEGRIHSSPAVHRGVVFVGSFDGGVYAFDQGTGARRWRFDTEGRSLDSEPVGFDRRSIISSPAVTDSAVYIGSRDGHLYAIDAAKGTLRWRVAHDGGSWSISSPAFDENAVYDASSDARFIHALRASTGERLWRLTTPGPVWSSPALAGGNLYIGDGSGTIHAIDRDSGKELWSYRTGGTVMSSPSLAGGVLYVGSNDGSVYALRVGDSFGLERAVYWDSTLASSSRRMDHTVIRDGLVARGYTLVAAAGLASWLAQRIRDAGSSVVVLALDQIPASLASPDGALRRYLNSGGKVVSPGDPPFIWPADPSGERDYTGISRATTSRLLDADHAGAQFDRFGARPTGAGRQWGLDGWWLSSWSILPPKSATVLALDERGRAAAWVRTYGGPPGTGFVQVNRHRWTADDLAQLMTVAEYRPVAEP